MSTIPRRLGKYELQQPLGRGSVGAVWKAHDLQSRSDVALKILHADFQSDPNFLNRFTKTGQTLVSLHQTNIVQVREVNITRPSQSKETTAYLAMDYIEGKTLADYIQTTSHKGTFPSVSQIVYLFTSLGVAIDYAHQQGVLHGNIKPSNILLNRQNTAKFEAGEPMFADFGLVQLLGNAASVGAPQYMSPEQAKGLPLNNRSDIYSLGVILYEICTGVQPFRDESSVAVMMQQINTLPTPPILINPNLPPALSEAILRAMAKDTATRFSMASLLATAIADACSMQSTIHISSNHSTIEEKEVFYQNPKYGNASSILGVSQRLPKVSPDTSIPLKPMLQVSAPLSAIPNNFATNKSTSIVPLSPALTKKLSLSTQSALVPVPTPPLPLTLPPTRPKGLLNSADVPVYIVVAALLLLLLVIGSAIGVSSLLKNKAQTANRNITTGHIFFQDDALGHNDTLRIEISNVATPPNGKSLFAWLQTSNKQTIPLGRIDFHGNTISFLYPGTTQHTNLLSIIAGLTITLEDTKSVPQTPTTSQTVYHATFDTVSFQQIKNILYQTPNLPGNQSVVTGLFETIKSMNDKANSIADTLQGTHDYPLVTRQATRIIEMIDGTNYAKSSGDLPADDPIQTNAPIGLISSPTQVGFIDELMVQLAKLKQTAGHNTALIEHIQNVENAVTDLRDWISKVRTYDLQLLQAPDLANPTITNTALQLKKLAADAYTGRTIPPNQGPQPILGSAGAFQAYIEAQYLATLNIEQLQTQS